MSKSTRREFLAATAATGAGFWVAGGVSAQPSYSPNEKIAMASIGITGKGESDSKDAATNGEMVAICDTDERFLAAAERKWPDAKQYTDFRKMFDEMGDKIDAVTVSTPDHTHAPAALMAMRMGKHCFCQKPLTRTIYEARLLADVAREMKVATQMGNQGTAADGLRRSAAMIRAGRLGTVSEIHVWTNRPIWPQGDPRPKPADIVLQPAVRPGDTASDPKRLHWDEWLGPAPERAYADGAYHPFRWRGWWDFGCGALGDMACHTMNMPFMGLDLRDPVSVQAKTSGHDGDSYPAWSRITYEFAANDNRPAVKLFWYDGKQRPDASVLDGDPPKGSGCVVIGDKGKLYSGDDYGKDVKYYGDVDASEIEYEKSPGHFDEWVRAIRGGQPARSNFPDYAGALTEVVLLGNLAVWVAKDGQGEKVEWDAKNMKVKNISGLEGLIKPTYRDGYVLDV